MNLQYVARGWAFMHLGLLEIPPDVANFQYPPLGYMLIGIFYFLIPSIAYILRARIFISVCFCADTCLILLIGKKFNNSLGGFIAVLLLGVLTTFIPLERLVLLENIGIPFLLLSFYFFIPKSFEMNSDFDPGNSKLSAFLFGVTILIKFTFAFYITAFIIMYYLRKKFDKTQSLFTQLKSDFRKWSRWFVYFAIPLAIFLVYILFTNNLGNLIFQGIILQIIRTEPNSISSTFNWNFNVWFNNGPIITVFMFFSPWVFIFLGFYYIGFKVYTEKPKKHVNEKLIPEREKNRNMILLTYLKKNLEWSIFNFGYLLFLITRTVVYIHYILLFLYIGVICAGIFIESTLTLIFTLVKAYLTDLNESKKNKAQSAN